MKALAGMVLAVWAVAAGSAFAAQVAIPSPAGDAEIRVEDDASRFLHYGAARPSQPLTVEDIRFTTQGSALYAIALGWPRDVVLRIHTLTEDSALAPGTIERIEAHGSTDVLSFTRSRKGLEIRLPVGFARQRQSS